MQFGQAGLTRLSWAANALALLGLGLTLVGWLAPGGKLLQSGGIVCLGLMQILIGLKNHQERIASGKWLILVGLFIVLSATLGALSHLGLIG